MRSIEEILAETIDVKHRVLADPDLLDRARAVATSMVQSYQNGGRAFFAGNGGSAADAQHFAAELTGHFIFDRPPLPGEVLHGNPSHVTAVANDYDYDTVFARALEAGARPGDVFVGLSTSGNSRTIVRAAEVAKEKGVLVAAFTGASGGALKSVADILINVPSEDTGRIQESHVVLLHAISEHVEYSLFGHLTQHAAH